MLDYFIQMISVRKLKHVLLAFLFDVIQKVLKSLNGEV